MSEAAITYKMLQKNSEHIAIVEGYGSCGEGIVKIEDATVFVPFSIVGEKIKLKILRSKGNVAYGKLISILQPSKDRVPVRCPRFTRCGGCDLQHLNYKAQLEFKRNMLSLQLSKIGGVVFPVDEVRECASKYAYRNKLAMPIGDEHGRVILGFYAPHSHRIVATGGCDIQKAWVGDIISAVVAFAKTGVRGYDENTKHGDLRHIVVREIKGKFIITLVCVKKIDISPLVEILRDKFKDFTLLLNINSEDTNVIFGDEWETVYGDGFFTAEEFGIRYKAGANTFVQVNDDIRAKLYGAVLDEVPEGVTAIDLYSGGGLLTAMLAKKCGLAYGIEVVGEASRCANALKTQNGLNGKMVNICGKVEEQIARVFAQTKGRRIIVCDPPRKGMERAAVMAIKKSSAEKIILISCDPATLARDTGLLIGTLAEWEGKLVRADRPQSLYTIEKIVPFDMFPQTRHVETMVCLVKKQKN